MLSLTSGFYWLILYFLCLKKDLIGVKFLFPLNSYFIYYFITFVHLESHSLQNEHY